MAVVGLLVLAGLFGVPYVAARGLWRIRMPLTLRVTVILVFPAVLVWWLATSSDFADITSPGAALIPLAMIVGWLLGTGTGFHRRVLDPLIQRRFGARDA